MAGQSRFTFDPGPVARAHPAFLFSGPGARREQDAGVAGDTRAVADAAAGRPEAVACMVDGAPLTAGTEFRWQRWPAPAGVLLQLRRTVAAPVTVDVNCAAAG